MATSQQEFLPVIPHQLACARAGMGVGAAGLGGGLGGALYPQNVVVGSWRYDNLQRPAYGRSNFGVHSCVDAALKHSIHADHVQQGVTRQGLRILTYTKEVLGREIVAWSASYAAHDIGKETGAEIDRKTGFRMTVVIIIGTRGITGIRLGSAMWIEFDSKIYQINDEGIYSMFTRAKPPY
ncbi:hypothetical protein EVAR_36935_1 [Eumeta japonica]|uniref:Uncharacterized protein n=1 Tax=Eumeta variegata TaxID=151549 RepID=A0A4C1X5M7_EUMVA|nr:hypothetical protein EVAR_36935_1 [Eumeta japonica]